MARPADRGACFVARGPTGPQLVCQLDFTRATRQLLGLKDLAPSASVHATPVGLEPTRGDPIGLAGRRLSHSAKVSMTTWEPREYIAPQLIYDGTAQPVPLPPVSKADLSGAAARWWSLNIGRRGRGHLPQGQGALAAVLARPVLPCAREAPSAVAPVLQETAGTAEPRRAFSVKTRAGPVNTAQRALVYWRTPLAGTRG